MRLTSGWPVRMRPSYVRVTHNIWCLPHVGYIRCMASTESVSRGEKYSIMAPPSSKSAKSGKGSKGGRKKKNQPAQDEQTPEDPPRPQSATSVRMGTISSGDEKSEGGASSISSSISHPSSATGKRCCFIGLALPFVPTRVSPKICGAFSGVG